MFEALTLLSSSHNALKPRSSSIFISSSSSYSSKFFSFLFFSFLLLFASAFFVPFDLLFCTAICAGFFSFSSWKQLDSLFCFHLYTFSLPSNKIYVRPSSPESWLPKKDEARTCNNSEGRKLFLSHICDQSSIILKFLPCWFGPAVELPAMSIWRVKIVAQPSMIMISGVK